MKYLRILLVLSIVLFQSCIQNDVVEDQINEKLSFNSSLKELIIKTTFQYETKYINNIGDVETPTIIWTSSNSDIISVSKSGLITALKVGTSVIKATVTIKGTDKDESTVSVENEITVINAEEELLINNLIQDLTVNTSHQYTTTYTNDLGENETPTITWTSSDPSIITVSNTGLIKAISLGNATITATAVANGKTISSEDVLTVVGIAERLSINNPINKLDADTNQTHQYTTTYTDQTGLTKNLVITWSSSNTTVASVSSTGLVTAISKGTATITASVTNNGITTTDEDMITIDGSGPNEKTGTIRTTSSYALTGTFTLKEIPGTNNLELSINADYNASTALPGLYLYMTNNPNTVGGAKEIQKVAVFNGAHTYIITNTGINDFNHLLYWCKPFGVKVGDAEIN